MVITPDNASLWLAAQKIVDIPAVDDAIMTLLSDMTGDNATHVPKCRGVHKKRGRLLVWVFGPLHADGRRHRWLI